MKSLLQLWQFLFLILAGWINIRQLEAIDYLLTENRVLREKLGRNRILLNEDQRRRLTIKDKIPGRKMLDELAIIVTPETILRWNRELVARLFLLKTSSSLKILHLWNLADSLRVHA